ncbi:MAG: PKD domain-containing protein [Armatimonadetes bacterium]|nr:PKD domain-containing protein [Armatimonadota bacterium]
MHRNRLTLLVPLLIVAAAPAAPRAPRLNDQVTNLLATARLSGNLDSFGRGLRGAADEVIYDPRRGDFARPSQYHEYGVGFGQDLGVVPADKAAWWQAEWPARVAVNLIMLSGVYPNQPQPATAWKIEVRRDGAWTTHEQGVGGWYDSGLYVWGGVDTAPMDIDGLRVSLFSRDDETPLRSIHFRGEPGRSWLAARVDTTILPPPPTFEALIAPLGAPVRPGQAVAFNGGAALAKGEYTWDFGDGASGRGQSIRHRFERPGIYRVALTVSDGRAKSTGLMLVRVHTAETLDVPQVVLDTDQKNEQDDQHYLGYAVFSELDVLAVNSIHHGGGQEPINYAEIQHVLDLARQSGLPAARVPLLFHGADRRLQPPVSGLWQDTEPEPSEASEAILAAVRGAAPGHAVWVVPVGPGTNVASAILLARAQKLDLRGRLRIMWLGGSDHAVTGEFNGDNDPWSLYVIAQSGVETWILPAPVGARVAIDKRTQGDLYADNPLGAYLKSIVPAANKPLFDPACLSAIISERLGLGWVKATEFVDVAGPDKGYRWTPSAKPGAVRVIREIQQLAMRDDIFATMKGRGQRLVGAPIARAGAR